MRSSLNFVRVGMVCGLLLFASQGAHAEGNVAITISGGGVAEFLDPNPCDGFNTEAPFGESIFSVGADIDADGEVTGHFICKVADCFIEEGFSADILVLGRFTKVLGVSTDGQDTVKLAGDAVLVLASGGIVDEFEFTVELHEGPPGTGGFIYRDYVTEFGAGIEYGDGLVDDGSDAEVVRNGHIMINVH